MLRITSPILPINAPQTGQNYGSLGFHWNKFQIPTSFASRTTPCSVGTRSFAPHSCSFVPQEHSFVDYGTCSYAGGDPPKPPQLCLDKLDSENGLEAIGGPAFPLPLAIRPIGLEFVCSVPPPPRPFVPQGLVGGGMLCLWRVALLAPIWTFARPSASTSVQMVPNKATCRPEAWPRAFGPASCGRLCDCSFWDSRKIGLVRAFWK